MAEEKIVIRLEDKIDPNIGVKIERIGAYAENANRALQNMKAGLASLKSSDLGAMLKSVGNMDLVKQAKEMEKVNLLVAKTRTENARAMVLEANAAIANAKAKSILLNISIQETKQIQANERALQAMEKTRLASEKADGQAAKTKAAIASATSQAFQNEAKETTSLERMAKAATDAATAQAKLSREKTNGLTATERLKSAQNQAEASTLRLTKTKEKLAKSASNVGVHISDLTKKMLGLFGIYSAGQGLSVISGLVSDYTNLQNKLRVITKDEGQLGLMMDRVFEAANRSRSEVDSFGLTVQRVDMAISRLGYSQEDSIRITETLAKSYQLSGASAIEMQNSLRQLTQAFNANVMQGDEFRSVNENAPLVMMHLAKSMGVPREQLKKLASQGKISAKVLADALISASTEIDKKFGGMKVTLSQATEVVKNGLIKYLGELEAKTGAFASFSGLLMDISKWFTTIEAQVVASQIKETVDNLVGSIRDLNKGLETSGENLSTIEIVFGSINLVVSILRDAINLIKGGLEASLGVIKLMLLPLANVARLMNTVLGVENPQWITDVALGSGAKDIKSGVGKQLDIFKNGATQNFLNPSDQPTVGNPYTERIDEINRILNSKRLSSKKSKSEIFQLNRELDMLFSQGGLGTPTLRGRTTVKGAKSQEEIDKEAKSAKDAIKEQLREMNSYNKIVRKTQDDLVREKTSLLMTNDEKERYVKLDEIRSKLMQSFKEPTENQIRMIDKQVSGYSQLVDETIKLNAVGERYRSIVDAVIAPMKEYETETKALNLAREKGKITEEEYNKRLFLANEAYQKGLNPMKEYNDELERQLKMSRLFGENKRQTEQVMGVYDELKARGIDPNSPQGMQELRRIVSIKEQTYQQGLLSSSSDQAIQSSLAEARKNENLKTSGFMNSGLGGAAEKAQFVTEGSLRAYTEGTNLQLTLAEDRYKKLNDLNEEYLKKGITNQEQYNAIRSNLEDEWAKEKLAKTDAMLSATADLMKVNNKELFQIGKAAAIAEATIDGQKAVMKAWGQGGIYGGALAAITAVQVASEISKIMNTQFQGYKTGGYTGNMGTSEVAGVVHGQEYVMNAQATRRNRAALERMNSGQSVGNSISVSIENYGTSKGFEVIQDENSVRIIARDEIAKSVPTMVAAQVQNPNSKISKSISANVNASRRR